MKIEDLWLQIEDETPSAAAWSTRFATPDPDCRLLVAIDHSVGARALLVRAGQAAVPPRRAWPECLGLELLMVSVTPDTYLAVRLRDPAWTDVFSALAEVLSRRLLDARTDGDAVSAVLDGLRRWQLFLSAAREGLGVEAQRGLFGELVLLEQTLVPLLGPARAVQGWKGFARAQQDFQFANGSIEVKTTSAVVPESVRIASERQLDDTGVGALFLHVVVVDEREVSSAAGVPGETLAGLVARTRQAVDSDPLARATLDDGLIQAGWLDAHATRYESRRLTVRARRSFRVREGFPRLLEGDLPPGIGDISYSLDLTACQQFEVTSDLMFEVLAPAPG